MFKLGILSDEISADFEAACQLIKAWGLQHVELRTMWGENILELSAAELDRVGDLLGRSSLTVTAIASPIFKSPLDGKPVEVAGDFKVDGFESFAAQLDLLRKAAALCKRFKTRYIRVFTFWRQPLSDALLADVAAKLIEATRLAAELDVVLAVENEPVCVAGTGRELGALFKVIRPQLSADLRPHIGVLWDPGNGRYGGEASPYPQGYTALEPAEIVHVHLKDVLVDAADKPQLVPLGQGSVDFVGQLQQLKADNYAGVLVLEPHYHPAGMSQAEAAKVCVVAAQTCLQKAFPDNSHDT